MINSGNYVLYADSSYNVKVKSFDGEMENHFNGRRYILEGIDVDFFILAVYIDNKRQDGFDFYNDHPDVSYHTDNLFMKSIINDLGLVNLDLIPLNHFLPPYKKVMFTCSQSYALAQSVVVLNQPLPDPYLHKYKNPKLLDVRQYSDAYNPYLVVYRAVFDSSVSNTVFKVISNDTFDNINKSAFSNLYSDDNVTYPFSSYVRFMDMYIKFEPKVTDIPVVDSKKKCWFEIRLDVRTNEFYLNYWYSSLLQENPNHPSGYYFASQSDALPTAGGLLFDTQYYSITIKFDI